MPHLTHHHGELLVSPPKSPRALLAELRRASTPGKLRGDLRALRGLRAPVSPWLAWQIALGGLVVLGVGMEMGALLRRWWSKPREKVSGYDVLGGGYAR